MAHKDHVLDRGGMKIGRQIVLPFSKAFEIAWKSIRIRIWRSLITMVGIVLAIAFLMSVWTNGSVSRALERVSEQDPKYGFVQRALRSHAITSESASIRVAVVGSDTVNIPELKAPPHTILCDSLQERQECDPFLYGKAEDLLRSLKAELGSEERADAVVMTSVPPAIANAEGVGALEGFVNGGGTLVVFGYERLWPAEGEASARKSFESLLPARPGSGRLEVTGATVAPSAHHASEEVAWAEHPALAVLSAEAGPEAEALARVGDQGVAWVGEHGEGTVFWYPVVGGSEDYVEALKWFRDGRLLVSALRWGAREKLLGGSTAKRDIWLVVLSLLVCIVGITNSMLMSVTERFREIGTMKCLGALDKFVVRLFLIESSLQGAAGSLVGVTVGLLLAFVRAVFAYRLTDAATERTYWLALSYFPWLTVLLWAVVAVVVGMILSVIAAIYPAYRAARMEPVEAMRVEA